MNNIFSQKPQVASEEVQEKLREKLKSVQLKEEEEKTSRQAFGVGLPYIGLINFPISDEALSLISPEDAVRYRAVCFYRTDREAKIASPNPQNAELLEFKGQLEAAYDLKLELYLISDASFNFAYTLYAKLPKITKLIKGVEITEEDLKRLQARIATFKDLNREIQKVSVSDLLTLVVASAVQSRSSDIHIEAEETDVKIRFRVDGVLIDVAVINKNFWPKIISRLKLISGLKINISNRPQDGRFTIHLTNDKIDVRVSCLPTGFGESVVMRLLRSTVVGLAFEDLGLRAQPFEQLKKEITRPNGMIITTGPTGSGKTTTLYAILNKLNDQETKIITLEDPIEYQLKGVNQSQVDYSKGYTFANGLRSILRQDPDVVMVGEIRDLETAEIAIQAALTGHLVISTLHTNDASGAVPRFLSMGVKPYLLSPAVNAIIGQRLVRKICDNCKEEYTLAPEVLEKAKKVLAEIPEKSGVKIDLNNLKFYHGKGCVACQGLGYRGRMGIYEIFLMNSEVEQMILASEASEYKIKDLAKKQGMVTMVQDGVLKALDGITAVEEVFRVAE